MHHDSLTLTKEPPPMLRRPLPAPHSLPARSLCGTTTYARLSRFSGRCPPPTESYPHPPVDKLSTEFFELSTGSPQKFAASRAFSCSFGPRPPSEVHVFAHPPAQIAGFSLYKKLSTAPFLPCLVRCTWRTAPTGSRLGPHQHVQ